MSKINKVIILFLFCLIAYESASQIRQGLYLDSIGNFMNFEENEIEFRFSNMKGQGYVKMKNRKLIIYNDIHYTGGSLSTFSFSPKSDHQNGEFSFLVRDLNNNKIKYSAGIYTTETEYQYYFDEVLTETDSSGKAHLIIPRMPIDSLLYVEGFLYNPLKIKLEDLTGGHFDIYLANGEFVYAIMDKLKVKYEVYGDTIKCKYKFRVPRVGSKSMNYELIKQFDSIQ